VPNLLKYALGLTPFAAAPRVFTGPFIANGYLALTYTRPNPPPADITYGAGVSSNLVDWCFNPSCTVTQATVDGATATVEVRDTVPITETNRRFLRLKITRP
jgi:hypothetical protein